MNELVTLGEAIKALKDGKTIYRQVWEGTKLFYVPENGEHYAYIAAKLWNGRIAAWTPTHDDILINDWIIE